MELSATRKQKLSAITLKPVAAANQFDPIAEAASGVSYKFLILISEPSLKGHLWFHLSTQMAIKQTTLLISNYFLAACENAGLNNHYVIA